MLHVIADLDHGGAQAQLGLLAESAAARGETLMVASLKRAGSAAERLRRAGVEVAWVPRRFRIDPLAMVQFLKLMRRWRPEVIQSWDAASGVFCQTARRVAKTPWLQVTRERAPALPNADGLIAMDPIAASQEGGGAFYVPNGIDPAITLADSSMKRATRQRLRDVGLDVSNEAPVIATVARLDRAEATNELVWAADLVRVVRPGLRLLIVGEGAALMACQRFADRAVEPGLVVWLGAQGDLSAIYAAADVVWVGAGGGAAPTPAIEALAAGKPVVLADASGRELLVPEAPEVGSVGLRPRWDDRAGWARSTKKLFEDPELAARIGREGHKRVRQSHTVEAMSAAYAEAVRAVLP